MSSVVPVLLWMWLPFEFDTSETVSRGRWRYHLRPCFGIFAQSSSLCFTILVFFTVDAVAYDETQVIQHAKLAGAATWTQVALSLFAVLALVCSLPFATCRSGVDRHDDIVHWIFFVVEHGKRNDSWSEL